MEKPTIITIDGKAHVMRDLKGKDWRLFGEFADNAPSYVEADFLEKHAGFVAQFFEDVTADDVLDLPLEDIMPVSMAVRNYIAGKLSAKLEAIEKNVEAGKAQ